MSFGIDPKNVQWFDEYARKSAENVSCWFGARAIFRGGDNFDLVWDRQQVTGGSDDERAKLVAWINSCGLEHLKKLLRKNNLIGSDTNDVRLEVDGHYIIASPKGSYGYLYIGIWRIPSYEI